MKRLFGLPLLFVALVAGFALTGLPSGYYLLTPGGAYDVVSRLRVPDEYRREAGELDFTAVYAEPGSWAEVAWARLSGSGEIIPAGEVRPAGISEQEYNQINRRLIDESKQVAAVVALRAAGYDARVTGQGAEVAAVAAGMPAAEVLQAGDIVVAVDGQPVDTATALVELIRRHAVGDRVTLTIVRDGARQDVTVGTKSSPSEPGRPMVGASVGTRLFDVQLPFPVQIDTENIGGSSAGLMFSLGILDAVTDGLLTRGHRVAGTGTLSADGTVGPIGAAAEKVMAAERAGADVFLVPREDEAEARRGARSIRVIPVETFDAAVRVLCGLDPLGQVASAPPMPCG